MLENDWTPHLLSDICLHGHPNIANIHHKYVLYGQTHLLSDNVHWKRHSKYSDIIIYYYTLLYIITCDICLHDHTQIINIYHMSCVLYLYGQTYLTCDIWLHTSFIHHTHNVSHLYKIIHT